MNFQWADGFHPPKNVTPDAVKAAIDELADPSPESMLEASKRKRHVLHEDLWAEGDQVWAQRGRLDRTRRIIGSVMETMTIGGKSISIRVVEFVRPAESDGRWATLETIRKAPELLDAYLGEVQRLQDQATAKLAKVRSLLKDRS